MAKNKVISHLVCEKCRMRNYTQKVSKKRSIGSLQLRKFCARCRTNNMHKETK